jgi:hypothetical protein
VCMASSYDTMKQYYLTLSWKLGPNNF